MVLGSTDSKKGAGNLAGLAIGLTLVLVHIVCIPITGTSVNPARSIAPALFQGGEALSQLWLFIIAPFVGAALSAVVWNYLGDKEEKNNSFIRITSLYKGEDKRAAVSQLPPSFA